MSREHADFARFSRELDTEWVRQRARSVMAASTPAIDEEALARELGQADPLGDHTERGWFARIADAFDAWPARLSLAGAACALIIIGVVIGHLAPLGPFGGQTRVTGLSGAPETPPVPVYSPENKRGLGMATSVKPESERRFQEAMAFYGTPDFARRAQPLLRAAITEDATNDQAQFWLGIALMLDGRDVDAVPALEEAVRLGPGSSLYRRYLLYAYLRTGAREKALALQTELLRQP
jgi:tetratricopeptide (TPR) repeat protein